MSDDEEGDKVGKEGDSDEEEKQPQEEIKVRYMCFICIYVI